MPTPKLQIHDGTIKIRFEEVDVTMSVQEALDFCSSLIEIFFVGVKFNRVGSKVNVMIKDVINPNVIIQPKSIIGFISLKINDRKAITVVKTVYKMGQYIFFVVNNKISKISLS